MFVVIEVSELNAKRCSAAGNLMEAVSAVTWISVTHKLTHPNTLWVITESSMLIYPVDEVASLTL